jgi:hypothetical protein
MTLDDPLLSPGETASALLTNERTLERWRMTGAGPAYVKVGRRVAYRRSALDGWLRGQTRRHTGGGQRAKQRAQ